MRAEPETTVVVSADGTPIAYERLGTGPGVVLVQGAMGTARNFRDLSTGLATRLTVYVAERRGRGASGPPGPRYGVGREVEDLAAILAATGSQHVFGLSSGAMITLQAARTLPAVKRIAVYEPPYFADPGRPRTLLGRLQHELAAGRTAAALALGMQGGEMGPPVMNRMPFWLARAATGAIMRAEDRNPGDRVTLRTMAPTLAQDFQVVAEMNERRDELEQLDVDVLLLGGDQSPQYLKDALTVLERTIPRARRHEFPGLGHGGAWDADPRSNPTGDPTTVAATLADWFTAHDGAPGRAPTGAQ
jgi:pimeloyl-ACP methyl ester carboxylesterase